MKNKFIPNPKQLKMGVREEMEHWKTVKYKKSMVRKIAVDHLRDDPKYYTKLKRCGL